MTISFDRPVGASADLKELEYVSALHQTSNKGIRDDGSINAADIRLFLRSRHGILVDEEELRRVVISGLGGGESDEDIIDLMEVVCILLIPTILKAARTETNEDSPLFGELPVNGVPPVPDMIKRVLNMILEDVTGDTTPKTLDEALIAKIFEAYGEMDLAKDRILHTEMLNAANPSKAPSVQLDVNTFASALVSDILEYELKNETLATTCLDDVLLKRSGQSISNGDMLLASGEISITDVESKQKRSTPLLEEWTAQSIDSTAGNIRNKYLMVTLVATVMISYFAYWYHRTLFDTTGNCPEYVYDYYSPWQANSGSVACEMGFSILGWLITFVVFSMFGLFFVGLGSLGNGVNSKRGWLSLVGMFVVLFLVVPSYQLVHDVRAKYLLETAALALGVLVMIFHLFNFIVLIFHPKTLQQYPRLQKLLRSSLFVDQKDLKQAGQKKINQMVKNALAIHEQNDGRTRILGSHFACGLHSFALNVDPVETSGGLRWTWHILMNHSVIDTYGIWFSDRLLSGNVAQYVVSIYVLVAGIQFSIYVVEEYSKDNSKSFMRNITENIFDQSSNEEVYEDLFADIFEYLTPYVASTAENCTESNILTLQEFETLCNMSSDFYECEANATNSFLCTFAHSVLDNQTQYSISNQLALLSASGFNFTGFQSSMMLALNDAAVASVDSLYPSSEYMIKIPLIIGTAAAFLISAYLAVTFLPSITSTILKLRCGIIPSLTNKDFNKYRVAPDQVSILTGSMFWGCLLGSFLVGGFIGLLVFLCVWQATVYFMARVIALFVGVLVVALIRIAVLSICRCKMYKAFYRERPFSANITLLALEWANFALSVGFILVRVIKLVVSACMFIGRIDTPFLAPNVGKIGPIELDNYPTIFMKDLLQHEAHRHPYMELLGVMYLMKLRYRDSFGSKAGAAWRLLFVYSLLPWMHKYRIHLENNLGFLVKGFVESTRGRISFLPSQRILLASTDNDDDDDDNEESKIFLEDSSTVTIRLQLENADLRRQVETLLMKQKSLLKTQESLRNTIIQLESNEEKKDEVPEDDETSEEIEANAVDARKPR